ncbi:hypothetical protein [Actinoplanes sp. NPDC051411]|uniref:hypothetical protein n=1 Tax=Actinoplanes sp. NPDC051411 TaxID=3155522 RepID=UPI00341666DD
MDKHTGMAAMIRSTLWDLGLPAATYYALHFAGVGDTVALMAGTGAAGVRLAGVALRSRRLSPFSLLMGAVFGVGLLLTEALVRVVLVYALPVDVMVGLSTALTVVTFGALFAWNARYVAARTREAHALAA